MAKPFRFGVQSFNADSAADWTGQVQRAEERARQLAPMKVKDRKTNGKKSEVSSETN